MKEKIAQLLAYVIVGIAIMIGFRIVEWVIPKPNTMIYVCRVGEDDKVKICKTLAELKEQLIH